MNIELLSYIRSNQIYQRQLLNIRAIEKALEEEDIEDISSLVKVNIIQTFEHMNTTVTGNLIPLTQHIKEIGESKEEYILFKDFVKTEAPFSMNELLNFINERPISKQPELLMGDNNITEIAHNNSWGYRIGVIREEEAKGRESLVKLDRSKEILRDHKLAKDMKDVVQNHLILLGENRGEESSIETKDVSKLLQTSISLSQSIGQQLHQTVLQGGQTQQLQPLNATEEKLQLGQGDVNRPLTDDEIALAESFERDMERLKEQQEKEKDNE